MLRSHIRNTFENRPFRPFQCLIAVDAHFHKQEILSKGL